MSSKRTLYVGGLSDDCTSTAVQAAFVPFGPLKKVEIPMDHQKGSHKGFAFVEFEDADDTQEALFNMEGAELLGRVLNVKIATDNKHSLKSTKALWATAEGHEGTEGGEKETEKEKAKE